MSETTTERTSNSKGNFLTKKAGPLPVWGWASIGVGAGLIFYIWKARSANSNSTSTSAGQANTSQGYSSVGGTGYSPYYYDGSGYPVQGTGTNNPSDANTDTATHPYALVSDIQDLDLALESGVPPDWLAYAGSDPQQSRAGSDPTLNPPTGLQNVGQLPQGAQLAYLGAAQSIAPTNAVKVYGATRKGTAAAIQQWYQNYQSGQENKGYYVAQ